MDSGPVSRQDWGREKMKSSFSKAWRGANFLN